MTNCVKSPQTAQPMPEAVNSTAARSMVSLRPKRSLRMPATATPPIDPISAQPTYQPTCMALSANRMPPMAATTDRNAT